jgi:two-component system sensor histidine kinase BaeS
MKLRIFAKLFIAMLLGVAVPLGVMMASVQWTFSQGFEDYLHQVELERLEKLTELLAEAYQQHGGWTFLRNDRERWFEFLRRGLLPDRVQSGQGNALQPFGHGPPDGPPPFSPPPPDLPGRGPPDRPDHHRHGPPIPPDPLLLGLRLRVLDAENRPVVGPPERPPDAEDTRPDSLVPIKMQDVVVGWLGVRRSPLLTDRLALAFVDRQFRADAMILLLAFAVSVLGSWLMAQQLIRPVRRIAAGVRRLASGDYTVRIPGGADELGDLARDVNMLGRTLQRNEGARRDWIADISHELRTPLAVLRGEIEALQDGVRPCSAETIASLHAEALSLGKLVDDLYELSLSDVGALDYRRERVPLADVVEETVESFRPRFAAKHLSLACRILQPAFVHGDRRRLGQLLGNLLENSLRYTEAGGRCELSLDRTPKAATIAIDDSAPGVPEELLEKLFERLFRVDLARTREHGGAGLGLAICRNIVEGHDGRISAHASSFGGLQIRVELPYEHD